VRPAKVLGQKQVRVFATVLRLKAKVLGQKQVRVFATVLRLNCTQKPIY